MSALANAVALRSEFPGRKRRTRAWLDGVVDTMVQLHTEHGARMFAFAAPHWRAGTTHVVNLVAEELAHRYRCRVAVMPRSALKESQPAHISQSFVERSPGVYAAAAQTELQRMADCELEKVWIRPTVRDFDFTLVDCPALLGEPQALRWTHSADGVFLVVAAGLTHVNQIEEAQRLLKTSTSRLEGIILNRRSYPVPELLYKLL